MKRIILNLLFLGAFLVGAFALGAQTPTHAKRDSSIADTLSRLRPYLSTGRDRNKADSLARVLRQPFAATRVDTVLRTVTKTDTLLRLRVDTVTRFITDTVWLKPDTTVKPPVDTVKPPLPPVVVDTGAFGTVFASGALQSSAVTKALGGVFLKYESDFVTFDEQQWTTNGAVWDSGLMNYYDRAMIWFAWWKRTGDTKYLTRANAMALSYRKGYLEPNNYLVQPHWSMLDGLALHFLTTGDEASRTAVGKVADLLTYQYRDNIGSKTATNDNRIQARVIVAQLLALKIKAPSVGIGSPAGIPGGNDWAVELRRALPLILSTQDSDGAWRLSDCGDGGPRAVHPFTTGLLLDALSRYYDLFEKDARIIPAIKRGADYLWSNDWDGVANAFKYVERVCPTEGGPNPAPDLNNLILPAYAWLYIKTGDATWKTRAFAIYAGAVNGAWLSPAKGFNQVYSSSWRFLPAIR